MVDVEEPVEGALVHGLDHTSGDTSYRRAFTCDEVCQVLLESFELVPGECPSEEVCELIYYSGVSHLGQDDIINYN